MGKKETAKQKPEKLPMKPYSYHTFIFPFLWNDNGKISYSLFCKCIPAYWELETLEQAAADPYRKKEIYDQYHYFNAATRNAIYTLENNSEQIVENYRCNLSRIPDCDSECSWKDTKKTADNPFRYVIEKSLNDGKCFTASLRINDIRLKLFSTGIGMIIFELENYEYRQAEMVNRINDYGRRIYKPYIEPIGGTDGEVNWGCGSCADHIRICCGDNIIMESALNEDAVRDPLRIELIAPILRLLSTGEYSVTTDRETDPKKFFIEPMIDDRMFVACFYSNAGFMEKMGERVEGEYRYLADAQGMTPGAEQNLARQWYQYLFVDGGMTTCYSRTMLREMLQKHTYDRWIELGTVHGVSEYSLVCACSDEEYRYGLDTPFLTLYVEMAILALAQRATLLSFERRISDASCGRQKIRKVQKDYIMFQSRLLLQEVTPQQQGIELYDMLLENLYINKLQKDIESQIEALFTLENNENEQSDNLLLAFLAIFSVFEVVGFFVAKPGMLSILIALLLCLTIAGAFFGLRRIFRNKN